MTTPHTPAQRPDRVPRPERGPGRPSVGTWKRLLRLPDDMLTLVERYREREGLAKMQDAIRSLIRAGLWSEGYEEAEHVRAVFSGSGKDEPDGDD